MSLDKKILDKIERENLKIRPRWFFAVKNFVFGMGTFSTSIMGSLSLALLFEIMAKQKGNLGWLNIPYLYLILLGVFLFSGYRLITKVGSLYKIRIVPMIITLFFISLSFGYLTFASGKAEKIEKELEKIPIYNKIVPITKKTSPKSDEKSTYRYENIEEYKKEKDNAENLNSSGGNDDDNNNKVNDSKLELKKENNNSENTSLEKMQNANINKKNQTESEKDVTVKASSDKTVPKATKVSDKKTDSHKDAAPSNEDISNED